MKTLRFYETTVLAMTIRADSMLLKEDIWMIFD